MLAAVDKMEAAIIALGPTQTVTGLLLCEKQLEITFAEFKKNTDQATLTVNDELFNLECEEVRGRLIRISFLIRQMRGEMEEHSKK